MNKITFPRIDIEGNFNTQRDIEEWYVDAVSTLISKKLSGINPTTATEIKTVRIIQNHLKLILKAQPQQLELWTKIIDKYRSSLNKNFLNDIRKAFNYDYFRQNKLVELAKLLNVKCCPYCNMHYTLYAEDTVEEDGIIGLAKFQFDHFYDKSEYPMLSMSLYNLIPSCAVCNHSKTTTKLSLLFHPYHSDICKQFKFELNNPIGLYSGEKINDLIDVNFIAKDSNHCLELDTYIQTFHLKALYQRHGDVAQEAFDKAYEYPYYSNPYNFKWLSNKDSDYIKRLWMGTYDKENEIEKRPMTKFIQDLWEQALRIKVIPEDTL